MYKTLRLIVLFCITLTFALQAQEKSDLEKSLNGLLKDAGSAYVAPVTSAFGANLNSGWVHRAPKAKLFGFDLEIGFVAMGTMFKDENKSFDKTASFKFSEAQAEALISGTPYSSNPQVKKELINKITSKEYQTRVFGPTILGKKDAEIQVYFPGDSAQIGGTGQYYAIAGKLAKTGIKGVLDDLSALPMAAPQITFGTIYGTTVALRYLPAINLKDLGDFKYFGIGVMHNPQAWLPLPIPFDVSAAFFTQSMTVGDFFKSTATTFGVFASKQFGPGFINVTPYAGFSVETSSIDVTYKAEIPGPDKVYTESISFNLKGENSTRLTVGASLKVLLVNLNVDYSLAKYNVASAGLSFYF